jgi:hypothetical protein
MFFGSIVGWPATALTLFRDEPQGILGLSWLALTITAVDILVSTHAGVKAEEN